MPLKHETFGRQFIHIKFHIIIVIMKNLFILSLLFLILIFSSCNKRSNKNGIFYTSENTSVLERVSSNEQPIVVRKDSEITQLYDKETLDCDSAYNKIIPYAYDVDYILLDPKDVIIGKIDKIEFFEDRLFILDEKSAAIYIFNRTGQFIRKICNKGRGPGEYLYLNDFSIDRANGLIVVGANFKIQYYDLDGNFISEHAQDDYYVAFVADTLGRLHFFSSLDQNIGYPMQDWSVFSQIKDSVISIGFPFLSFNYSDVMPARDNLAFRNGRGEVLIRQLLTDSIFRINSDLTYSLHAYFEIESGQSRYNILKNFNGSQKEASSIIMSGYKLSNYYETSAAVYGSYLTPKGSLSFLICRKTGKQYHINHGLSVSACTLDDDRFLLTSLLQEPKAVTDDDRFVGYIWPMILEEFIGIYREHKKDFAEIPNKTLSRYLDDFELDGNPLIVTYKIGFREGI